MSAEAELEKLAERILEDESLRRGLTDEGFQPLLDWAMLQLNRSGRGKSAPRALGAQLPSILQAAAVAASSQDLRQLQALVTTPVFSRRDSTRMISSLSHLTLTNDPIANAIQIANALTVKR